MAFRTNKNKRERERITKRLYMYWSIIEKRYDIDIRYRKKNKKPTFV